MHMYIRTTLWTLEYFYSIKVVKTRHLTQTGYIAVHRRNGTSCTFTCILNPLKASVMNQNIIKAIETSEALLNRQQLTQNKHNDQECQAFTCLSVSMLIAHSVSAQSVWGNVTRWFPCSVIGCFLWLLCFCSTMTANSDTTATAAKPTTTSVEKLYPFCEAWN